MRHGVRFRHGSLFRHQASGRVNSSSARALCGIGIAAYVATFLFSIFHLPLSRLYLDSLEKASPTQTWPAGRLRSHELEDTCTNADGWHEWKWFQMGDVVFDFSQQGPSLITKYICWMQNKLYFPALKPANLKETLCMAFEVICELA